MSKSYDLSTSTKWANLADGEHTVTLRAKASNYGTSNASNSVTVTKAGGNLVKQEGETWVLNEDWSDISGFDFTVNFVSNSINYNRISLDDTATVFDRQMKYDNTVVLSVSDGWLNQAYRTITFSTPPTGELLTWLQANGTKQGVTEHTLTFSGVSVTVDGVSVTSPYTLTSNATISVIPNDQANYGITVNGTNYYDGSNTVSIEDSDITISSRIPTMKSNCSVTINYTA